MNTSRKLFRSISRPMMEKGLGFTSVFRKTAPARRQAKVAADVALDQNIMPLSGNPETALDRATALTNREGAKIGGIRESIGPKPSNPVIDALERYRAKRLGGARGGKSDLLNNKIDEAIATVKGLPAKGGMNDLILGGSAPSPTVSVNRMAAVKRDFPSNYQTDAATQEANKAIKGSIEEGIEDIIRSSGVDMTAYRAAKRSFGAAKLMKQGLNPEIARQGGNMPISLPSTVLGAGQLGVTGNPAAAAATAGIYEALKRRGAGAGARLVEGAGKQLKFRGGRASMFGVGQAQRILTEDKAKDYLKKAKGDRPLARRMAISEGWTVPK